MFRTDFGPASSSSGEREYKQSKRHTPSAENGPAISMHANVSEACLSEVLTILDRLAITLTIPTNSPFTYILAIEQESIDEFLRSIISSVDPSCDVQTANVHVAACSVKVFGGNAK